MEKLAPVCLLERMTLGAVVARRLRQLRLEHGLSQEELAGRAGLNRNYVGMIERQENSPTVATLEKLAAVLRIEPKLIFDDAEKVTAGAPGAPDSKRRRVRPRRGRATAKADPHTTDPER